MLLASDFDGTIFVENKEILNKNIKSINDFRKNKNIFVIITGRGICSIKKELIKNNIKYDYLLCNNGAMIFDNKDNILSKTYLEEENVLKTIDIIKKNNFNFMIDTGLDFINSLDVNTKQIISIYIDKKTVSSPTKTLKEIDNKTNTYNYISPNWINMVNKKINKEKSLKKLLNLINYDGKVFTIGDAINDLDMIKEFDGGIMKIHEKELDLLPNKKYEEFNEYIKELI